MNEPIDSLRTYRGLSTRTWKPPLRRTPEGIDYLFHGLASEVGEVSALRKRQIRDGMPLREFTERLAAELGDCLWYLDRIAEEHGLSLGEVALVNVRKLADRLERGVLKGEGDHR